MEKDFLISVCAFEPFGPARTKLMLGYFKKAKNIWNASKKELNEIGIKEKILTDFLEFRKSFDKEEYLKKLEKLGIKATTIFDKDYPENLNNLSDAPHVLYIRGEIKKTDSHAVAIVGTRLMTSYGREVAGRFAAELANYGITVISGLALGVDAEAQRSAVDAGGRTIGVLASGLDIISPLANLEIAKKIIGGSGALVSEYPLGHLPRTYDFPVRDRLISALSKAVIVVEGRMKSGTFYTVKAALDQGLPVFAVPGPITSIASEGPNYLIQNGAKLAVSVKDILEELDLQIKADREVLERAMPETLEEKEILKILDREPLHLDELARISGSQVNSLSARLTIMEMKGMIKNLGKGIYRKI